LHTFTKEKITMRKLFFIVFVVSLSTAIVSAQTPQPADPPGQPRANNAPYEGNSGGEAGMEGEGDRYGRGYGYEGGYGRGGYGGRSGGYETNSNPRGTRQLVDRWKASREPAERDKIEKTLRETLHAEFNARLAAHEKEIKDLEEKVRQLRARLNLRREKQDEIVDHRLQQLLRDAQGLGWGSDEMSRRGAYSDVFYRTAPQDSPANPLTSRFTSRSSASALEPAVDAELTPTSEDSAPAAEPVLAPSRN
jgi:hypothetical protein